MSDLVGILGDRFSHSEAQTFETYTNNKQHRERKQMHRRAYEFVQYIFWCLLPSNCDDDVTFSYRPLHCTRRKNAAWFKLLLHLYNTDTSKGNTELISGMHYTNGIQKKVSRLIQICIPFGTITYVYSILRNCHNIYNTVYIPHVKRCF